MDIFYIDTTFAILNIILLFLNYILEFDGSQYFLIFVIIINETHELSFQFVRHDLELIDCLQLDLFVILTDIDFSLQSEVPLHGMGQIYILVIGGKDACVSDQFGFVDHSVFEPFQSLFLLLFFTIVVNSLISSNANNIIFIVSIYVNLLFIVMIISLLDTIR